MSDRDRRALSFGAAADSYDRFRPTYPPEALRWALGDTSLRVADLGAGTGILTRVLVGLGHDVVAVEPDPGMLERLAATTPGAAALAGSAESMPLDDASVDAVVAGQAYHWFDRERAHSEVARVLRSGGVFAPLWNIRDTSVPWVAELTAIAQLADHEAAHDEALVADGAGPSFGALQSEGFPHAVAMTADSLVALIGTRSYYLTATPGRRAEIDAELRRLAAGLPEVFDLPYTTVVHRARRR